MEKAPTPSEGQAQFDEICAQIGEWESLPMVAGVPTEEASAATHEQQLATIDGQILAGLVSP
jgi:hypothetical protein